MTQSYLAHITETLAQIDADGMMKRERMITSPQGGQVQVAGRSVINLCANNYLGLADHPDLIAAAKGADMGWPRSALSAAHKTSTASWN